MRLGLTGLLALFALAACAPQMTPQQTAQIKSLAIVTGFGEQIELNFVGFTVFTNSRKTASVDWEIDKHFKERGLAELGSRYEIREIAYDPAKLRQPRSEIFSADPAIALVQSVARPGVADAILYFGPAQFDDTLGRSNQSIEGLGLYARSVFGLGQGPAYAYAAWRALLFDGATLQLRGQAVALFPLEFTGLLTLKSRIPNALSGVPVTERYESLSSGQRKQARALIFDLVTRTMPTVLSDLALR